MDNEPGTSIEADKNLAADLETTCSKKKQNGGGGTTCCIPKCDSNTKNNSELSFYQIPTDMKLRNMWYTGLAEQALNLTSATEFVQNILWVARRLVFIMFQHLCKKFCCLHQQSPEQHLSV